MKRQTWVDRWDDPQSKPPSTEAPVKAEPPKRQKWVDSWDEPKTGASDEKLPRADEPKLQESIDHPKPVIQEGKKDKPQRKVWVDRWDVRETGTQTDKIAAKIRRDAQHPAITPPLSNTVQKAEQSVPSEEEPRLDTVTQSSTVNKPSTTLKSQQSVLRTDSGNDNLKTRGTPSPSHARETGGKPVGVQKGSGRNQAQAYLPENRNPSPEEITPQTRGLQHSRWAQGNATAIPQNGYRTPTKLSTIPQRPAAVITPFNQGRTSCSYTPSAKTGPTISTQEAGHVTPTVDVSIPLSVAAKIAQEKHGGAHVDVQEAGTETKAALQSRNLDQRPTEPDTVGKIKQISTAPENDVLEQRTPSQHFPSTNQPAPAKASSRDTPSPMPPARNTLHTEFASQLRDRVAIANSPNKVDNTSGAMPDSSTKALPRDPRGKISEELPSEQEWNETRRPKDKKWDSASLHSDDVIILSGATRRFLEWWTAAIPDVKSDFLERRIAGHENCDIDTCTGSLMEPVDYPETLRRKSLTLFRPSIGY